jgi:protein farnesyltransferase/geranylgeranyltransferase type-1 subunit alpha
LTRDNIYLYLYKLSLVPHLLSFVFVRERMSDMEEEDAYIPFSLRSEWVGVTPIAQDDGPKPPVPIAYSPQFVETMNYFRFVLQTDERSERSLKLTKEVIECNSANYTAWYFRRLVLESLCVNLLLEFELTEEMAANTPKNYQLWFHRRWLVENVKDHSREFEFTSKVLRGDSKNYHAWAHRQWVVFHFQLHHSEIIFQQELTFIENMISLDVRNNSAWNYRFYLLRARFGKLSSEQMLQEITFVWKYISRSPNNQSSWGYLRGLLKRNQWVHSSEVESLCLELVEKHKFCANAYCLLVDFSQQKGTKEGIQHAIMYCQKLLSIPTMYQKKYWELRLSSYVSTLNSSS